jgi:hypothetical protein
MTDQNSKNYEKSAHPFNNSFLKELLLNIIFNNDSFKESLLNECATF